MVNVAVNVAAAAAAVAEMGFEPVGRRMRVCLPCSLKS